MVGYVEWNEYCIDEIDMAVEILEICEDLDNFGG